MPFGRELRDLVDSYARSDLDGGVDEHVQLFDFLGDDPDLQRRVGEEYFTARYLYKVLEGLRIEDDWARRAQVQLQVQQYASIYEACIHHLLFTRASTAPEVEGLLRIDTLKQWSVSRSLREQLEECSEPNGRVVVAAIRSHVRLSEEKVRFDSKARAAVAVGLIDQPLADEMVDFYSARNMIHIHAELKRGEDWAWKIEFARQAYWRLQRFVSQAREWVSKNPLP